MALGRLGLARAAAVALVLCAQPPTTQGGWISDLLGGGGGGGADDADALLHERAAAMVEGSDDALSPDGILWSPKLTRSAFYSDHWEGRAAAGSSWLHLPGQDRLDAGLSTHADRLGLDAATLRAVIRAMDAETARAHVKTAQLSGPSSCAEDGRACVERASSRNDTLVFDGGEYLLPAVHSLVDAWKRYWNVYVGANFYLTPAGTQAFGYHSDHTDVFVLQLEGTKHWSVCDRVPPNLNEKGSFGKVTHFFPPSDGDSGGGQAAQQQELSSVQRNILSSCRPVTLRRGDTLYLPAGVVHRAIAPPAPAPTLAADGDGDAAAAGGGGASEPQVGGSLHCSVSVSRTHHQHSWATFIETVLRTAGSPSVKAKRRISIDEDFIYFVHSLAATGGNGANDRGGRLLLQVPAGFSSSSLPLPQPAGEDDSRTEASSSSTVDQAGAQSEWEWNRLAYSIDPTTDLPSGFPDALRSEFGEVVEPLLSRAAKKLGGGTTAIVMERIAELRDRALGDDNTVKQALATAYSVTHSGMMKPLEVKKQQQQQDKTSPSYHTQQAKRTQKSVAEAEENAKAIHEYVHSQSHSEEGLDAVLVQRPAREALPAQSS